MTHNEIFQEAITKGQREMDLKQTLIVLTRNQPIFWSWGVSKRVNLNNLGLMLKVSGHHHKGWVLITLGWEDLYRVHIISNRGLVLNEYVGIYFDDLVEIIDNRIEKIKDYEF